MQPSDEIPNMVLAAGCSKSNCATMKLQRETKPLLQPNHILIPVLFLLWGVSLLNLPARLHPRTTCIVSQQAISAYCRRAEPQLLKPVGSYCCNDAGVIVSYAAYCITGNQVCAENLCPQGTHFCNQRDR